MLLIFHTTFSISAEFPLRLLNKQLEAKTADILRQSEQLIVSFSVFSKKENVSAFIFLGIVVQNVFVAF